MKTVFDSQELAHVWARQSQEYGRAVASMFFEGTKIYSYGRHFCIADIVAPNTVLFTTRTYSVTTAKHINWVSYACNHMRRIYVPNPASSVMDNLSAWQSSIKSLLEDLSNPRKKAQTKDRIKGELSEIVKNVNAYLQIKGVKLSKKVHADFLMFFNAAQDEQAAAGLQAKLQRQAKAKERKLKIERAKQYEQAQTELKAWKAGRQNKLYLYHHLDIPVALRAEKSTIEKMIEGKRKVEIDPDRSSWEIQTSKGARVDYNKAQTLYKLIDAGRDVVGHNIDGYTVISCNGVLKIGCHVIDRKEIERLAKKEGWK